MSDVSQSDLILAALCRDQEFAGKVQIFLKPEYFEGRTDKLILEYVRDYLEAFKVVPTMTDIIVTAKKDNEDDDDFCAEVVEKIHDLWDVELSNSKEFMEKTAEDFCKDKALYNAIQKAIQLYDGEAKGGVHAIPETLREALSVCFDTSIGQEWLEDAQARFDYYKNPDSKIPFDIEKFNEVTNGGVIRKTLNLLAAGINVGKTMSLVSLACMYMRQGLNVLYISCEMREEEILKRADANNFNVDMKEVPNLNSDDFLGSIERLKQKNYGKLVVKAMPTGTGTAATVRATINEIRLKKGWTPDVVIFDYLQIMSPNVKSASTDSGSYSKYKTVAEELRALMMEFDAIGWTAAQFNRTGLASTDPGMEDIGESTGIPATVDGMWALVRTEELDASGQLSVIELKSRYGDKSIGRFNIGVSLATQRLYDVEDGAAQTFRAKPKGAPMPSERPKDEEGREKYDDAMRDNFSTARRSTDNSANKRRKLKVID